MSHKQTPPKHDDFKQIKGIGPATERRLHDAGVLTYAQLAESTPEALADLLSGLVGMSVERVVQEEWLAKAAKLAEEQEPETAASGNGQHYATFTVELLLDQQNDVRRTRVAHVQQAQHKDTWAGWQEQRLIQFITKHAELATVPNAAAEETAVVEAKPVQPTPKPVISAPPVQKKPSPRPKPIQLDPIDEKRMVFVKTKSAPQSRTPPPPPAAKPELVPGAAPELAPGPTEEQTLSISNPRGLLAHDHGFDVKLHFNPIQLPGDHSGPFSYKAAVFAQKAGNGQRLQVGSAQGTITQSSQELIVSVPTQIQNPGTYRLEAEMSLIWQPSTTDLTTRAKGALLHVY